MILYLYYCTIQYKYNTIQLSIVQGITHCIRHYSLSLANITEQKEK